MIYDREFLTGILSILILSLLDERPMHAHGILQEAERRSDGQFLLKEGTIYPALHQMMRTGLLRADVRLSETGYSRKHYSLTDEGRRVAQSKRQQWEAISAAMRLILRNSHPESRPRAGTDPRDEPA